MAEQYPWGPVAGPPAGIHQRLAAVAEALSAVGPVEVFSCEQGGAPPPVPTVMRVGGASAPLHLTGPLRRLAWLVMGRLPLDLARDWTPLRQAFRSWLQGRYDLVWFSRETMWLPLHDLVSAPAVVDLPDLDEVLASRWLRLPPGRRPLAPPEPFGTLQVRRDRDRWRALHTRAAATATVVVCSDHDRRTLALPNVAVVPNSYRRPPAPAGAAQAPAPPTLLLAGQLTWPPNADAARTLATEILPRVRRAVPDARVRLVGPADDRLQPLAALPGVTVTGPVPHMASELAAAAVVAVPLRVGSGTRVKLLEAFANRVPVVSTAVGAEGLTIADGCHLLLADDPAAFSAACVRVIRDEELRCRLVDAAEALFLEHYDRAVVSPQIQALASRVAA